jgi:hypothetical protein
LEYAIRKGEENQVGQKLNGTHQLLVYADDINLLGDILHTIKKKQTLTTRIVEINAKKTKYMLMSRHQNAGRNRNIKTANRSFENVAQFRYAGTTVMYQHFIHEEIKTLNSGNACHRSDHNLLSSRLLSKKGKNQNIQKYKFSRGFVRV